MILWLRSELLANGVFLSGLCVLKCSLCCDLFRCSDYSHRYKSVIAANYKFNPLLLVLKQVLLKRLQVIKKSEKIACFVSSLSLVWTTAIQCSFCFMCKILQIGFTTIWTAIWTAVTRIRPLSREVIPKAFPMFEMWSSVTSKLEASQQQQPHTSSGSIKGAFLFHILRLPLSFPLRK